MKKGSCFMLAVAFISIVSAHKVPLLYRRHDQHHHTFSKRSISSDTLFSDYSIIAPISIGTPSQDLFVLLDTSSSDLALFTSDYISQFSSASSSSSSLGTAYDSSSSSSYQSTDQSFQNNYGSGTTSSYFEANTGTETVSIEGLTLSEQPFALMEQGNVSYGPIASGILGLAFEATSTGMKAMPAVQQLYLDGALSSPLFSFALMRPSSESESSTQSSITQPGGIFTLGQLDTDQYQGDIGWSPLVTSGTQPNVPTKWLAALDNITINGVLIEGSEGMVANFDTGSSASRASESTLPILFANAEGALMSSSSGEYYLPCGNGTTPAMNMTISMGGISVDVEPLDLLYKTQAYTNSGQTYCKSTLSSTTSAQYDLQVGNDILRSLFVAFQYDPPRVGLAEQSTNVHNQAAQASYVFNTNDDIAIDSLVSPSASASVSHVSVETVASTATAYVPVITIADEVYTFSKGGSFVSTANVKMQTVVASSTPAPIGPIVTSNSARSLSSSSTTTARGLTDTRKTTSSASIKSPPCLISLLVLVSASTILAASGPLYL